MRNGSWLSHTSARPSIPSSIPVPIRPAADCFANAMPYLA
jgi:hypothetical protein